MGYTREEIKESLSSQKYNEVTATYLLLGRKTEVSEGRTLRGPGDRGHHALSQAWATPGLSCPGSGPGAVGSGLVPGLEMGIVGSGWQGHWYLCASRWRAASPAQAAACLWQGCGRPARSPTAPVRPRLTARASAAPPLTTASDGTVTSVSACRRAGAGQGGAGLRPWCRGYLVRHEWGWAPVLSAPPPCRWPIASAGTPQAQPHEHRRGRAEGGAHATTQGQLQHGGQRAWHPPLQPHGEQCQQSQQG